MGDQQSNIVFTIKYNLEFDIFERALAKRLHKLVLYSAQYAEDYDVIKYFIMVCKAAKINLMIDDCEYFCDDYIEDLDEIIDAIDHNESWVVIQKLVGAYFRPLVLLSIECARPKILQLFVDILTACDVQLQLSIHDNNSYDNKLWQWVEKNIHSGAMDNIVGLSPGEKLSLDISPSDDLEDYIAVRDIILKNFNLSPTNVLKISELDLMELGY